MNTSSTQSRACSSHVVLQLGLFVGAVVLGGCASTVQVQVPATELSKLTAQAVDQSDEWPTVRTVDGKETQIVGTVESVEMNTPEGAVRISRPFYTRVNGPFFEIMDPVGVRGFPLAANPTANVQYANAKIARNVTGGVLIGVGAPVAILGIVGLSVGADIAGRSSGDPLGTLVGGTAGVFIGFLGFLGVAGGAALTIPGIYMVATNPAKPERSQAKVQPQLHIGPRGASVSVAF
jgi:hypothetical protein